MNNVVIWFIVAVCFVVVLVGSVYARDLYKKKKSGVIGGAPGGGLRDMLNGLFGKVSGGAKRAARKFESVAGDRSKLETKGSIDIKGKNTFKQEAIDALIAAINEYKTFAPISADEKKHVEKAVADVNKKFKTKLDLEDGLAVRDIVVSQRISNSVRGVIDAADKINEMATGGKTALEIATELNMPPMAVMRQILLARNDGDLKKVNEMMRERTLLPKDIVAQVNEASEADHGGRENMDKIFAASAKYEEKLGNALKKAGVAFKTEAQLKEEQTKDSRFGRPIATPDFFFPNPIKLNGVLVNWIDCKNFPLFSSDLLTEGENLPRLIKSMTRQALKYNKHFGRGAFVFSGGMCEGIALATKKGNVDVDLVDGSSL